MSVRMCRFDSGGGHSSRERIRPVAVPQRVSRPAAEARSISDSEGLDRRNTLYTEQSLKTELGGLYSEYRKQMPRWYKDQYGEKEEIDRAWKLYSNASRSQLSMLVLGDISIRGDKDLLKNMGTTAAYPMTNPSAQTTGQNPRTSASNRTGSVLNEQDWWPLPNDAWLLGGVNSLAQFHLASGTNPSDDLMWDASAGRPRVLGRELIGLFAFGYIRIKHGHEAKLGIVFGPNNKKAATEATFTQYLFAVTEYVGVAQIKAKLVNSKDYSKFAMP